MKAYARNLSVVVVAFFPAFIVAGGVTGSPGLGFFIALAIATLASAWDWDKQASS